MDLSAHLDDIGLDEKETNVARYCNAKAKPKNYKDLESMDSLTLFVNDADKFRRLSREEEYELSRRQITGDTRALDILTITNLKLVVKIAHDFKGKGLLLNDLVAEGLIGLVTGIKKYDPDFDKTKKAKLSTYVACWIKQAMYRAIANQANLIRIPIQSANTIGKIRKLIEKYQGERELTNEQIAKELNCSERTVKNLRHAPTDILSLDEVMTDCDLDYGSLVSTDNLTDIILAKEENEVLYKAISKLNPKEQHIIIERFGLISGKKKTLTELETSVGRTRERIRQMEKQALSKLLIILKEDFHYEGRII